MPVLSPAFFLTPWYKFWLITSDDHLISLASESLGIGMWPRSGKWNMRKDLWRDLNFLTLKKKFKVRTVLLFFGWTFLVFKWFLEQWQPFWDLEGNKLRTWSTSWRWQSGNWRRTWALDNIKHYWAIELINLSTCYLETSYMRSHFPWCFS